LNNSTLISINNTIKGIIFGEQSYDLFVSI